MVINKDDSFDDPFPTIVRPSWLGKSSEKSVSSEELKQAAEIIESDTSHSKNGWTPQKLAMYFKERKEAQSDTILHRRIVRPTRTEGWHNGHRWRR